MCGWCLIHDHDHCIPKVPSDPKWRCICAQNGHRGRPQ